MFVSSSNSLVWRAIPIVLGEQNVHLALAVSDHPYVLAEGRVELEGNSHDIANMGEVRRACLGL